MVRLAFTDTITKVCGAILLALLSIFFTGCANSCFSGFWNPPNGAIGVVSGNPPPACALPTPKATLQVVIRVTPLCDSCTESNRIKNVFVTLRGIQLHPKANPGSELADWEEVFPHLGQHPRQVDLMKAPWSGVAAEATGIAPAISAGIYDVVRLLFVPNQRDTTDRVFSESACGTLDFNCVVLADGQVQPLLFVGDAPELRISSERMASGPLSVSPGSENELLIELMPVWSMTGSPGEGLRFVPILEGSAKFAQKVAAKGPNLAGEKIREPES